MSVFTTDPEAVEELLHPQGHKEEVSLFVEIVQDVRGEWRHGSKWVAAKYAALASAVVLLMVACVAFLFLSAALIVIHFTRTAMILLACIAVIAIIWGALFVVVPEGGEKLRDYERDDR